MPVTSTFFCWSWIHSQSERVVGFNFYAGGFLHADVVRTLGTSNESLETQVAMVKEFAEWNFLKLNVGKCEVVMFSKGCGVDVPECIVYQPRRERTIKAPRKVPMLYHIGSPHFLDVLIN